MQVHEKILFIENNLNLPQNHAAFIQFINFIENINISAAIPPSNLTTNWNLLYLCNQLISSEFNSYNFDNAMEVIKNRENNNLIWDSIFNCSQQYSLFSIFILSILCIKSDTSRSILSGFINRHCELIFSNNPNWFGRGRNQLFGDSLFIACGYINYDLLTIENKKKFDNTLCVLLNQYRKLGFIPFTRSNIQEPFIDFSTTPNSGWYQYNSYIDYFFFSYYLLFNVSNPSSNLYKKNNSIHKCNIHDILKIMKSKSLIKIIRFDPLILHNRYAIHVAPGSLSNITLKFDGKCLSIDDEQKNLIIRILKLFRFCVKISNLIIIIFSLYPLFFKLLLVKSKGN